MKQALGWKLQVIIRTDANLAQTHPFIIGFKINHSKRIITTVIPDYDYQKFKKMLWNRIFYFQQFDSSATGTWSSRPYFTFFSFHSTFSNCYRTQNRTLMVAILTNSLPLPNKMKYPNITKIMLYIYKQIFETYIMYTTR